MDHSEHHDHGGHDHMGMMNGSGGGHATPHVHDDKADMMHGMDHGEHGMHGMMMKMYFHFTLSDIVLFDFWKVDSYSSLISSMIGIFFAAMMYEGLKYFREYLYWNNYNNVSYENVNKPNAPQETERPITKPKMLSKHHLLQTGLHIIQVLVSYLLMLIFMTYNVWLCLAVVLGSATGYFLFGWKKSLFVDVTEHCH